LTKVRAINAENRSQQLCNTRTVKLTSLKRLSPCLDIKNNSHSKKSGEKLSACVAKRCHSMPVWGKLRISSLQDAKDHLQHAGCKSSCTIICSFFNAKYCCHPSTRMLTLCTLQHLQLASPSAPLQKPHKLHSSV
jgi:hypothetical protein